MIQIPYNCENITERNYVQHFLLHTKKTVWRAFSISACLLVISFTVFSQSNLYDIKSYSAKYDYAYNQIPDKLVSVYAIAGATFQWQQSDGPINGFANISGSTLVDYTFTAPLLKTTYFRRATTVAGTTTYSNIIQQELVSVNWENRNYVRENDILKAGLTDWKSVDLLPIGDKLQTTTYIDGLGRSVEKINREVATPPTGNTLWGDMVQFSVYDAYGREPKEYLPYTTTTESGKYKTTSSTDQPQYYIAGYNETNAFSAITFENNPLNRASIVNAPGTSWGTSAGNTAAYSINTITDNVQIFSIGYNTGDIPVSSGAYPANTLYKNTYNDENGNPVIEYTNKSGQLILTKTQISSTHNTSHDGWICVYNVYDDFGQLRYVLQPEAVKYLDANGWSFAGTDGPTVLNELCFRYEYDEKGRTILKKAPLAALLRMLYDNRDRIVFMQDGNQAAKSTPEWTANLYDELDRNIITTIYKTNKTITDLQNDINNSVTLTTVTVSNTGTPIIDLTLDNRNTTYNQYVAQNSISFVSDAGGDFVTPDNDNFSAYISSTGAYYEPTIVTVATFANPVSQSDLSNPSVTTPVKYLFYDDYSFAGVKAFDNAFANTDAYSNGDPIAPTKRTISYSTGNLVRVLGTPTFLPTTFYYDEKGRPIQTNEENIKFGQDVTTLQYAFDSRVLSTHTKHSTPNTGYNNFSILTKNIYDKIGRISSLQKRYGANDFKTIASYDYDDMGRLKTKRLDPGYTGSGKTEMESLDYSYNIHNQITGINKDYALKTTGKYDKWGNFFGLYLGYDNRDNVFNAVQLDGHVTGLLWNTEGDDAQRKYDYTYDQAGRLTSAIFKEKQKPGDAWDNSKMDFSITGSSNGKIKYDLNGNLLSMWQKGVLPGSTAPVDIDKLTYTYTQYSNKLIKVKDNTAQTTTNGQSGDFKDGTNGTTNDYVYDQDGNIVTDLNKNAKDLTGSGSDGISYNYLDKPEEINISGKGKIKIVYDADGNKLQKIFTPNGSAVSVTTTYINGFVYKGNELLYINFEEGRIRVITPVSTGNGYDALIIDGNMTLPAGKEGVYDFFIRDYQENVRMILTEEIHNGSNKCSMEVGRATNEEPIFGQTGAANEVVTTRFAVSGIPGQSSGGGWSNTAIENSVSLLQNSPGKKTTGPNVLLKVMAGDLVNATTQYYYQNTVVNTTGSTLVNDVLLSLIGSITGSSATGTLVKGATGNISSQLGGSVPFTDITEPDANNPNGNKPKAYLTILFFDERFNFVEESSTSIRVSQRNVNDASLTLPHIKAPKNGYVYVYVSNESNEAVYFDNLNVGLNRGRIIAEDHYYAYGLKIAAISSQKLPEPNEGYIDNKNLYNDKELFDEADLDWYDYGFRNYDAQIGRFTQLDPLTWEYPELTNFQYASCEPIANIDVDGLEKSNALKQVACVGGSVGGSAAEVAEAGVLRAIVSNTAKQTGKYFVMYSAKKTIKQSLKIILGRATGVIGFLLTPLPGGNARPKGPSPFPGYHWGGDQWVPDVPFIFPQSKPDPQTKPEKPDDDDEDEFVYRRGGYTDNTFTPKQGDADLTNPKFGLSVDLTSIPGVTSQKISLKKLYKLGFSLSLYKDHISIIPTGPDLEKTLKDWASYKGKTPTGTVHHPNSHRLTKALIKARVPSTK